MARPATVLSNASGHSLASGASPSSGDKRLVTRTSVSPSSVVNAPTNERPQRVTTDQSESSLQPPSMSSEWSHLVDTATKAILDPDPRTVSTEEENNLNNNNPAPSDQSSSRPGLADDVTGTEAASLLTRLAALEAELRTERRARGELEEVVGGLREDNARLREESQTAAQQLRRFTEWFFQTIDKS